MRIAEVAYEHLQRTSLVHRVRIGEHDDLAAQGGQRPVQSGRLAFAPRLARHDNPVRCGELGGDVIGAVSRGIRDHHHVEQFGRVVQLERVLELAADHAGLVERGDHEAHVRQAIAVLNGPSPADAHDQRDEQGIARVDEHEERQ
jgi:hypothetical protein